MATPSDTDRYNLWIYEDTHHFEFLVKSCKDAVVFLSSNAPTEQNRAGFELTIGANDNTRTILRKFPEMTELANVESNNVLNCQALRAFWVYWYGDQIKVGTGKVLSTEILTYNHGMPNNVVLAVSLVSPEGAGGALWEFMEDAGKFKITRKLTFH